MLHPRARTMLLLSLPAVAIGIASSLILIVVMKIASVLQNLLWQRTAGNSGDSPGFTFLDHRHINANRYCGGVGYPFQPGACRTRPRL
ncbi:putative voltage gated chloride channel protein [Escherichia coli]|uniref:Putative voltage gated chloride channel protein n=1 Tax=Escherichia coli TaxID=562 RepID=A0A376VH44_ECOLX|nr:putative voltage gated chloride channel protein [Escherichia coli]